MSMGQRRSRQEMEQLEKAVELAWDTGDSAREIGRRHRAGHETVVALAARLYAAGKVTRPAKTPKRRASRAKAKPEFVPQPAPPLDAFRAGVLAGGLRMFIEERDGVHVVGFGVEELRCATVEEAHWRAAQLYVGIAGRFPGTGGGT